jgi:hypothetical protein
MTPRLTAGVLVSALIRGAQARGGFAAVLKKGDSTAGAILIVAVEKGVITGLYERLLTPEGAYVWGKTGPQAVDNKEEIDDFLARKAARDPDLWVIELDIADAERFIADCDSFS